MARPPNVDVPVVVVRIDTLVVAWCDGHFTGDDALVEAAKSAAQRGDEYLLGFAHVTCDSTTPLGAVAAMCALRPGRAEVLQAPDEVHEWFANHRLYCGGGA